MRGSVGSSISVKMIKSQNRIHGAFLAFLDMCFASMIVAPLVVIYWRGTWNLSKLILFPDNLLYSGISSGIIGITGHFIFFYCQDMLSRTFHPDKHRITFMVVSRLYTYIFGIVGINGWLGLWDILDIYCPFELPTMYNLIVISTVVLVLFKGFRNVSSTPFGVSTDHSKNYFVVTTMFKSSVRNRNKA